MTKRKLRKELSTFSKKTESTATLYSGSLGIYIGGTQYVDVPNRPGFVYVRLRNNISELIQAHNEVVSPVYGLPVILIRNKTYYEIYGRDSVQYGSYWDSSSSYLPKHGHQHEFDPDNNGGGDLVFVHGEQFYPMMTFPSGSNGGNTVLIAPYRYFYSSAWHYTGNTGVGNLLTYGPTGANNAKLLLVGVDATTGNPFVKQGSEFSEGITGAAALTSFVPTNITQSTEIPGAIIRLVTGTQTITWANIYDARQYMGILQVGGGATDFLGLSDTPNSYAGQANKAVVVKPDESGLEFVTSITGSSSGGGGTGTYFDGIQETFFPTLQVSNYTGSYYYFDANSPANGTELDSPTFSIGNNQFAFAWITKDEYDLKNWLLRGEYTFFAFLLRSTGSHPMTAYAKLYEEYSGTETELAVSDLAVDINGSTAIPTSGPNGFAFRMRLENNASMYAGPTYVVDSTSRLLLKVYVNVASGGSDGVIKLFPDNGYYFNVNLQRQVLDNHYLTGTSFVGGGGGTFGIYGRDEAIGLGTGTTLNVVGNDISLSISGTVLTLLHSDPTGTPHSFLDLTDTPDSYSGQGSKYVAVNSGGTALEFVPAPAGGGGGGSGLVVYDDSVYKVTGTAISFDSDISVAVTGSIAYVSNILPWQVDVPVAVPSASTGSWAISIDSTQIYNFRYLSDGNQNRYLEYLILLSAGTWTMTVITEKGSNRGIATLTFDGGSSLGTIDAYSSGATVNDVMTITGIVVPTTKLITMRLAINSKNGSSSAYHFPLSKLTFTRTS